VPSYDGRGRLTGSVGFDSNGIIQSHWGYQYDKNNNRTLTTRNVNGTSNISALAYNSLNQLLSGGASFSSDVSLPVVGSLDVPGTVSVNDMSQTFPMVTQATPTGGTVFSGLVELSPGNPQFIVTAADKAGNQRVQNYSVNVPGQTNNGPTAYNSRGQMTRDENEFYHWNPLGQLHMITYGSSLLTGDRTEFVYNALGQRIERKEYNNGGTNLYEHEIIGYLNDAPAIKKNALTGDITYIFGLGMMSLANGSAGAKHFFSKDRLGSVHGVWNQAQQLNGYLDYSPYGVRIADTTTIDVPIGFTGMDWHERAELMLVKYRVMDPNTGRWLSREPLGEFENLNLYSYGYGNPLSGTDTTGLFWNWVHNGLEGLGLIPGVGVVPDLINATLYGIRGDTTNALWALGAAIPIVGIWVTGAKWTKKASSAADEVIEWADHAGDAKKVAKCDAKHNWEVNGDLDGDGAIDFPLKRPAGVADEDWQAKIDVLRSHLKTTFS
jgi:RHS repeat-associated protein